jgi:hypothetical protein
MKNRILAMPAAAPAIPPNPRTAAMIASTKNASAHESMMFLLFVLRHPQCCNRRANQVSAAKVLIYGGLVLELWGRPLAGVENNSNSCSFCCIQIEFRRGHMTIGWQA